MTLSERIKECRQKAGMSQEKVAELVGVSRQAVTKWESGQSAPNTENMFKLAEIFGTTVDFLLTTEEETKSSPAEQIYYMYKLEQERKRTELLNKIRRNVRMMLVAAAGWLGIYLIGKLIWTDLSETSVMGLLFHTSVSGEHSYLFGWLIHRGRKIFWYAMMISTVPALFGKYRFSLVNLVYFVTGLLVGIWLGPTEYGTGEYGWAFWGGIYLASIPMGIALERLSRKGITFRDREGKIWICAAAASIVIMTLVVMGLVPDWKMP